MGIEKLVSNLKSFPGRAALYLASAAVLLNIACSKPTPPKPSIIPDNPTYENVELGENTVILGKETSNISSYSNGTLNFSTSTPLLESIEPGDFILADPLNDTSSGLIGKVVSKNNKTILLSPATLDEALKEIHTNFSTTFSPSNIVYSKSMRGVGQPASTPEFGFNVPIDIEEGGISAKGGFSLNSGIDVSINVGGFRLDSLSITSTTEESADISVSVERSLDFNKEIVLANYFFSGIPIPGTPLFALPQARVTLGISANADGSISSGAHQESETKASLVYRRDSAQKWSTPFSFTNNFDYTKPKVAFSGNAKGAVNVDWIINIQGIAGPSATLEESVELEVDTEQDPEWGLYWRNSLNLGIKSGLFKSINYTTPVFSSLDTLAQAEASPLVPVWDFSPRRGPAPLQVTFDGSASQGNIIEYNFLFGDGTQSRSDNDGIISHTYFNPGTYIPRFLIRGTDGKTQFVRDTVFVESPSVSTKIRPGPEGKDAEIEYILWSDGMEEFKGEGNAEILELLRNYAGSHGGEKAALIEFPLSEIPYSSRIVSATLNFYGRVGINSTETPQVKISRLEGPWNESSVTWANQPESYTLTYRDIPNENLPSFYSVNVTPTIQDWIDNGSNYGFKISTPQNLSGGEINSGDHPISSTRPYLDITYIPPSE